MTPTGGKYRNHFSDFFYTLKCIRNSIIMRTFIKHTTFLLFLFTTINGCTQQKGINENSYPYVKFYPLKISQIHPRGWILEFLRRQRDGLTGHIEVAGYPFNTCMWGCEKIRGSVKAWWPYEQTAYYIDGVHRLGLLLDDDSLIQKAGVQTRYVLDHIDPKTGRVSTKLSDKWWRWPYANFFRNYMTDFRETGDTAIVRALEKHYLTFKAADFADDLELANVEEICWIYGITNNEKLLNMAEDAYELFKSDIRYRDRLGRDIQFASDRDPDQHAVVYLELVKIPAILYKYTGKREYLDEAVHGLKKMEKYDLLVSGLPSSTEGLDGISELAATETCNTAVFPYTYGYFLRITGDAAYGDRIEKAVFNGGLGAVTKNFISHQYFSAPNQFIATLHASIYGHHPARMAYLPGHDVECCTGNVNRFMPYYAEQMWLGTSEHGLAAALLGPSSVNVRLGKEKTPVTVTEETQYPFSEKIVFQFQMENPSSFPFYIRIPAWCKNPEITVNGKKVKNPVVPGSFFKLKRKFRDNDQVTLLLPMEVVVSSWPHHGVALERGPLVFSYPVRSNDHIVSDYPKSTEDFPAVERRPAVPWNYALDTGNGEIDVVQKNPEGYPWDIGNVPVRLKVPARKVLNWQLALHVDKNDGKKYKTTSAFPENPEFSDSVEYIELVPYGSTLLRLTVFPEVVQ